MRTRVFLLGAGCALLLCMVLLLPWARAEEEGREWTRRDAGLLLLFGDAEFVGEEIALLARRTPPLASMAGFSYLVAWVNELRIPGDLRDLAGSTEHDPAKHGLAAATRRVLGALQAPVKLHVVLPAKEGEDGLADTAAALERVTSAFDRDGGERVEVIRIDASTAEGQRQAVALGVRPQQAVQMTEGEVRMTSFLAGIVVEVGDERRVLGEMVRAPVHLIERDIATAILGAADLVSGEVGLVLARNADGAETNAFDTLRETLQRTFGDDLHAGLGLEDPIPSSVRVLLVVGPTELERQAANHLDAHLTRGGHAIVLLDPVRWTHVLTGHLDPIPSGLEDWLAEQGIEVTNEVACDPRRCAQVPVPVETADGRAWHFVNTPAWPYAPPEGPAWFRSLVRGRSPEFTYCFPAGLHVRADADAATRARIEILAATTEHAYLAPPAAPKARGVTEPAEGTARRRIALGMLVAWPINPTQER